MQNLSQNPFEEFVDPKSQDNPFREFTQQPEPQQQGLSMAQAEPQEEGGSLIKDAWGLYGMGSGRLLSGLGWLFDSETLSNMGKDTADYWERTLSNAQKEANSKRFVTEDYGVGDAVTDPRSWGGAIVQSIPAMVPGIGAAGLASKVSAAAGAATGSLAEGMTIGAMVGDETYQAVMNAPDEMISQSPYYQDLLSAGMDAQTAREATANKASESAALPAGVGGAILGIAFNRFVSDAVTGSLSNRVAKESMRGLALEGTTEAAQGALESAASQYAQNEYAGIPYDVAGGLNEVVAGTGAGMAMGGAVGAAGAIGGQSEAEQQEQPPQEDPAQPEMDSSDIEGELEGNPFEVFAQEPEAAADPAEEANVSQAEPEPDIEIEGLSPNETDDYGNPIESTVERQNAQMRQADPTDSEFLRNLDERFPDRTEEVAAVESTQPVENETGIYRVNVDDIQIDPEQYQFRTKVNNEGVDNRLDGVEQWDDTRAGVAMIHRREDGSMYVADGHHRVSLAKRLGQDKINARFIDEADGVTVERAREEAAMNNIADGKAEAVDIAKVIRDGSARYPIKDIQKRFNLPSSQLVRDGEALSKLSSNVFGLVTNGQLSEKDGAAIGGAFNPDKHEAAADVFQKVQPQTAMQRELLINEIKAADFAESQGEQGGLFGDDPAEVSLLQDRLKLLDNLRSKLNTDKRLFNSLNNNAGRASEAGNVIAKDSNAEIADQSARSVELIGRVATTPALNEMVNKAARRVAEGESVASVANDLKSELINYEQGQQTGREDAQQSDPSRSVEQTDTVGQNSRRSERASTSDESGTAEEGERSVSEGQSEQPLLDTYTEQELFDKAETEQQAKQTEEKQARESEQKEKADRARDDFQLTGSDRTADANPNQGDIFDTATNQPISPTGNRRGSTETYEFPDGSIQSRADDEITTKKPRIKDLSNPTPEEINALIDSKRDAIQGYKSRIERGESPAASEALIKRLESDIETLKKRLSKIEKAPDINDQANEAATSPKNDLPEPTEAQKEAGNYKVGKIKVQGLDISIENPQGSERKGTSPDGKEWANKMGAHYGYIRKTEGADGDHVDVFVGDNPESKKVWIVDQVNADGSFDEHKVLLGFNNQGKAKQAYKDSYDKGWKVGPITPMSIDEFKTWLEGDTTKPLSNKLSKQKAPSNEGVSSSEPPKVLPVEEVESQVIDIILKDTSKFRDVQDVRARVESFFSTMEFTNFVQDIPAQKQRREFKEEYKQQKAQLDSLDKERIIDFVEKKIGISTSASQPQKVEKKSTSPARKPKKAKGPSKLDRLENYFQPGRVIESYMGNDKVIAFKRDGDYKWHVDVVAVDADGNVTGQQRSHSTEPSAKALAQWEKENPVSDKPKVTENKVFTEDAAEKARALLRSKLGQLNSGLDPEILQAGITLAGYHIEKGARTFSAYAKAMVADMGDTVKPYLKSWYVAVRFDPRASEFSDEMDAAATVESVDVENALNTEEQADAEYSTSPAQPDSEGDAEPSAQGDLLNEGRGRERQGSETPRESASDAEGRTSDAVDGDSASTDRESSNKPLHNAKPRVEGRTAGSTDDIGSLPDSTGGLFADQESGGAVEQVIEQTPASNPKLSKTPSKASFNAGNLSEIKARMPFLTEGQVEDVAKTEDRFSKPDGFGMLFTNGTGTGKTFTGLGVVRRHVDEGKKNVLIMVPKQTIADGWIKAGRNFFELDVTRLESTQDAGQGVVVTTYANVSDNDALVNRDWDLVIADESHYLSSDKDGKTTKALTKLRALTLKSGSAQTRVYSQNSEQVAEMRELYAKAKSLRNSDDERSWQAEPAVTAKADKIRKNLSELTKVEAARLEKVKPEDKPRALFLSATPFAYDKNIIIGQEFLFDWGSDRGGSGSQSYNHADNFQDFMMTHFGYRMRYGKLTTPDSKVDSGLMERAFNAWLKEQGALSGRTLDSDFDYDRRFILAESKLGRRVDEALSWLRDSPDGETDERRDARSDLHSIIVGKNFDYHARMYFLEAIKAREAVPYIREYLESGYQVLVMHDFKKGGTVNPFRITPPDELRDIYNEFKSEFKDLIRDFSSLPSPITLLSSEFPEALIYNGDVSAKNRVALQDRFNDDADDGARMMIAQGDAMREGVSIHDTTGKYKRVLIHLGMPGKPTAAIQQEGRIYRTGQMSDAIFRYFTIGSNWERYAFASTIAQRAGTAENLAMGEQARGLKDSFIEAYEEAGVWKVGMDGEGKGGKARDQALANILTPWDMAKSYYFGTKKQGSGRAAKGREGADYFATPEPLGMKMVEWADIRGGESVLEPSAGHGAIGRWFPENTTNRAIEQSDELASKLSLRFGGEVLTGDFEDHNIINKYDAIVMNPPFGSGGKQAADHVRKAMKHLRDGGRVVALVPTGPAADKQFDKLLYPADPKKDTDAKDIYTVSDITLPSVTFERAGTSVAARVLVLEKQSNKDLVADIRQSNRDYSSAETIEEFFDRIESAEIPPRTKPIEEDIDEGSTDADPVELTEGVEFTTMDSVHTQKGHDLFVVNIERGEMGDDYARYNDLAKKHGGFYIRARGRNFYKPKDGSKTVGTPTFSFSSEIERSNFLASVNKATMEPGLQSRRPARKGGMSVEQLQGLFDEFMGDYNGNIPLDPIIVENQEDIYGQENSEEALGYGIDGSYHAKSGKLVLIASALGTPQKARKLIQHEVLGHYGLNTFTPEDKRALLDQIIKARSQPGIKEVWEQAEDLYPDVTELEHAEEVFAFIAEKYAPDAPKSAFKKLIDVIGETFRKLLRKIGFNKNKPITRKDIEEHARAVAEGIRDGSRSQQNFPESDQAIFRRESGDSERTGRIKTFLEGIQHQPIDRMFRVLFDVAGLVDSHGRLKGSTKFNDATKYVLQDWKPQGDRFEWMSNLLETARHGLIDRYKLSDDYKQTFREAEAVGRQIDNKALDILNVLERNGVNGAEAAVLQRMLTGEEVEAGHLQHLAEPILRAVDDLGLMAVEYGIITREQFERNRGAYLHRSYLKHEGTFSSLGKWIMNQQSKRMRKIKGKSAKGRGIEMKVDMERLMRHVPKDWFGIQENGTPDLQALNGKRFTVLENQGMDPTYSDTLEGIDALEHKGKVETIYWPTDVPRPAKYQDYRHRGTFEVRGKRKGKVVLWRDFTKSEREHMGEILDARYNIAKTFQVISQDIAMGKFFQDVAQNEEWFQRSEPVEGVVLTANEARNLYTLSKTDWVHVPETIVSQSAGTKQWGALAGGYVRAEIWRDLTELDKMNNPGLWRKVLTQWKLNKTARSPVVHMNNVMSNLMLMDLADVRMTDLVSGIQSYYKNDEHKRAAEENGAFEGTFANEELRRKVMEPILDALVQQNIDAAPTTENMLAQLDRILGKAVAVLKRLDNGMTQMYQVEDELFRMATYMRRLSLGDTPQEAAKIAREQFLDYDIRAPWVNAARRTVLPFISYTYRAVPVLYKAISERPWKLAKYATLAHVAMALAYAMEPGDEDEEFRTMRDDQQGNTWLGTPRMMRMPYKDEHGNPVFMDVRRWIPAGDVFDMNQGNSALPVPAPIQFGGPLMLAFEFALNKQAFTGRDITSRDTDTPLESASKTADWLYKSWMPSAAYIPGSHYWEKIDTAASDGRDILGRPYSVSQAFLSSIGIKVQPHDVKLGYAFKARDLAAQARIIKGEVRRAKMDLDRKIISKAEYNKTVNSARKKLIKLSEEQKRLNGKD